MTHKQRILELLRDGRPHTHHELYALGCVAHSRISDLRNDGYTIECWRDGDDSVYQLGSALDEASSFSPDPVSSGAAPVRGDASSSATLASGDHVVALENLQLELV